MCCFSGPVRHVAKTQIFARLSGRGTQYLVYQMRYEADQPVAMILPLPVQLPARADSLRFINLQSYPNLFDHMGKGFPDVAAGGTGGMPGAAGGLPRAAPLPVQNVGSFEASFVPTMADFNRLDRRFVLPVEAWEQIPEYRNYSFAVFKLKKTTGITVHPMAMEFRTRMPRNLFFPTVHIHDGEWHPEESFDHFLYCQAEARAAYQNRFSPSNAPAGRLVDTRRTQEILLSGEPCHRRVVAGKMPNADILLPTA